MGLSRGGPRRGGPIRGSGSGKADPRGTDPKGPEQRGTEPRRAERRGPCEGVKSRGSHPTMAIRGCLSRSGQSRGGPTEGARGENVRAERADRRALSQGCRSKDVRTAGERQARQTLECENDQANGQVIAQPPPHGMRAEIADDQLEMSQSDMSGRRRKMKRGNNRSIDHPTNQ